jgi:L-cysteine S-thiosulfotransferase
LMYLLFKLSVIALLLALAPCPTRLAAQDLRPQPPKPGHDFQSTAARALEADDSANPGMLWVEQGASLWHQVKGKGDKSCASCHGEVTSMAGVAARYPKFDLTTGKFLNLELRINQCRSERQQAPALEYESNELLALTALLTYQSRGLARHISIDGPAQPVFDAGRRLFTMRQGQLNLACSQCHDENWGKRLRGDVISQGQTDGWPAYRLEWQTLGSLHRRLRTCSLGVRAQVLDFGSPEYLALELYLAWRGAELAIEAPGVRR